jgi:hypothetical protein
MSIKRGRVFTYDDCIMQEWFCKHADEHKVTLISITNKEVKVAKIP